MAALVKALGAVSRASDRGNRAVFEADGGYVVDAWTGPARWQRSTSNSGGSVGHDERTTDGAVHCENAVC